jgi:hypothetical protein
MRVHRDRITEEMCTVGCDRSDVAAQDRWHRRLKVSQDGFHLELPVMRFRDIIHQPEILPL